MTVRPAPASAKSPASTLSSSDSRRSGSPVREPALPPSESTESRRLPPREERFLLQYGSRLHSYSRDKAPYPMSYNREDLELVLLDYELIRAAKCGAGTLIDFSGEHPKRCLDLGCGMGAWTIAAARDWPDCTFVGYDLMNVQIPLWALEEDIASRVEWVHGNFLRQRLPFEDEEFDYVHIQGLAFAVPENKWISLYEEIRRILSTGGTVEQVEEDAIFPVLPRWFTEPLHAHIGGPGTHYQGPGGSPRFPPPSPTLERRECDDEPQEEPHEHAFLQSLFNDVFENRFINPVPSSCLPVYFSAIFGQVNSPPVLQFPMPPLAPLAPLPIELEGMHLSAPSSASERSREQKPPSDSDDSLPSADTSATDASESLPAASTDSAASTEPTTHSALSSSSNLPLLPPDSSAGSTDSPRQSPTPHPSPPDTHPPSHPTPGAPTPPAAVSLSPSPSIKSTQSTHGSSGSRPSVQSQSQSQAGASPRRSGGAPHRESYSIGPGAGARPSVPSGDLRTDDSSSLGDALLFPMDAILSMPERTLNMQLFRALGLVMSVKEAMWEELCERVRTPAEGRRLREACGWEDADFAEARLREKFEGWVERYRTDVRARVSLWHSMVLTGWQFPRRDPITRAEMLEEERLRQDILEARKHAREEDLMGYSRSLRLLVGTKVRIDSMS